MSLSESFRQPLIDTLRQLVRIDSRSDPAGGREAAVQALIAGRMRELGAQVRTVLVDDLASARSHPLFHGPQRSYRDRPTVIAEMGPANAPALLVMAHSDTVPLFAPEQWTVDPFAAELRDGRIYGLGASDDKWGLATILTLMHAMPSQGPLKKRLIFASTVDEENGVGNGTLLLHLAGVRAEAALYLDGYGMELSRGNCGGSSMYLRPRGSIPFDQIDRDLALLRPAAADLSASREALFERDGFEHNWARRRSILPARRTGPDGPFIQVGFYTLAGERPDQILQRLDQMVDSALGQRAAAYDRSIRQPWFEPALVPGDLPLLRYLSAAAERILNRPPTITTTSKIDGFVLTNHAKIPTVSFGCTMRETGRGAFHEPDEYLSIDELWTGCRIAFEAVVGWLRS